MCGPAEATHDEIAFLEAIGLGRDDLAHSTAFHLAVDGDVGGVGFRIIHAAAHIGVQ